MQISYIYLQNPPYILQQDHAFANMQYTWLLSAR